MVTSRRRSGAVALLCAALLGSAMPVAAQRAAAPQRITYAEALALALRQNITLQQAQNAVASSEATVRQLRMVFLPTLNANVNTSQNVGLVFNQIEGRLVDQQVQAMNAGISSNYVLFNGRQNSNNVRQARYTAAATGSDLARARQTVAFTVASNFLSLITLQEQLAVQEANLKAQRALAEQVTTLVTAGKRSIADQYSQNAIVASAQVALVAARRSVDLAKVDLVQTLRLDPGADYEFVTPAVDSAGTAPTIALADLLARALQSRPELRAGAARIDAANAAIRSAGGTRWPVLSLNLGLNTAYTSLTPTSFSTQLGNRRNGSLGLGFSVPIFDRGSASIATQQANIQLENVRLADERQRQTVTLEVRRAVLDYESAREQLNAARAQSESADLAASAVAERYRVGAATLVELTVAQAAQVAAANALVTARYNLVFQRSLLSYYTGELEPATTTIGG